MIDARLPVMHSKTRCQDGGGWSFDGLEDKT